MDKPLFIQGGKKRNKLCDKDMHGAMKCTQTLAIRLLGPQFQIMCNFNPKTGDSRSTDFQFQLDLGL